VGSQVTPGTPRVYLDANVFIAAFENVGAHSDHAWWILRAIEDGEITGMTSEITLAELLVKPLETGATDLAAGYEKIIAPTERFEVLPVSREIIVSAAGVRARRNSVKLPDAIHIATAHMFSCAFFVSDDSRVSLPDNMTHLPVSPFTLDDIFKENS
jgi:predicted nucleic acid-binding protein